MFRTLLFISISLLAIGSDVAMARCASAQGALDYEGLQNLIKRCKVSNIEELIPLLPESYRKNFSLAYRSQSETELKNPGTVTPSAPRVILFGGDGKLVLSFTGNPDKASFQELQLFQYREKTGRFEFSTIEFQGNVGKPKFHDNPTTCKLCHGEVERPLWGEYPQWPGIYGHDDDTLIPGSVEDKNFNTFVSQLSNVDKGRYASLFSGSSPKDHYQVAAVPIKGQDYTKRSNTNLTFVLARLQAKALGKRLAQSKYYPYLKDGLAWMRANCSKELPLEGETLSAYVKQIGILAPEFSPKVKIEDLYTQYSYDNDGYLTLQKFIVATASLKPEDVSLLMRQGPGYMHYFVGNGSLLDKVVQDEEIRASEFEPLMKTTSEFSYYSKPGHRWPDAEFEKTLLQTVDKIDPAICKKVLKNMKAIVRDLKALPCEAPKPSAPLAAETQKFISEVRTHLSTSGPVARKCAACHTGADPLGPPIPFDDFTKLSAEFQAQPELRGKVIRSITLGNMPKNGEPLKEAEKVELLQDLGVFK